MNKRTKFECKRCGECCRVPAFFKVSDEYKKVETISEKFNIKFTEIHTGRGGTHMIPIISKQQLDLVESGKMEKALCPFLIKTDDNKTSCSIYEMRPVLCKMFGNIKSCSVCSNIGR